jgi:hypothetical protein
VSPFARTIAVLLVAAVAGVAFGVSWGFAERMQRTQSPPTAVFTR